MSPLSNLRAAIVAEARDWIGTPYRHQASLKGAGCDCLGLVRGVWRALIGPEPVAAPDYAPDWAAPGGGEPLLQALQAHFRKADDERPGDVLAFRMAPDAPARHVAIVAPGERIIHAYWGRAVLESRFVPFWRARTVAAFSFPGVA